MEVFGQNPNRIVSGYSEEFESAFLEHMKRSHRFSRVAAKVVYNEYIADRQHIHMNSTEWATLTEFVKYLGRTGKCKVEETPKGWFITYIDRDSETLFKEKMKSKRVKADIVEEEKQERAIKRQRERAEELMGGGISTDEINDSSERKLLEKKLDGCDQKVKLSLGPSLKLHNEKDRPESCSISVFDAMDYHQNTTGDGSASKSGGKSGFGGVSGGGVLDELMREEEQAKEQQNRKDYWLCEGIVVKVMSKGLANKDAYYKKKGVVRRVIDKYVGEIEILENKHIPRVDQEELETVIPQIGGLVRIVNGAYRGSNARLLAIDTDHFSAKVKIEKGIYDGKVLKAIDYEDICKLGV
ncbi:unnamed protein product [Cuscuta europaea]|uniref:DNA/RNA-binding protein Kin17 WH-like domain-containing protein n=1 Tax=Cuscuta europaea TaxID=41803 RepID=A0A9P0ZUV7_CUSEU|nr:unnamed protein product [Cuscuta europaea]